MLIEFRNAYINTNALAALVVYDDDGKLTVRIMLGAHDLTFNEVTMDELTNLVSALRAANSGGCAQK